MQEINEFLQYVESKFSEVLLPVENITKQGILGKGYIETIQYAKNSLILKHRMTYHQDMTTFAWIICTCEEKLQGIILLIERFK